MTRACERRHSPLCRLWGSMNWMPAERISRLARTIEACVRIFLCIPAEVGKFGPYVAGQSTYVTENFSTITPHPFHFAGREQQVY